MVKYNVSFAPACIKKMVFEQSPVGRKDSDSSSFYPRAGEGPGPEINIIIN